jgi:transposase
MPATRECPLCGETMRLEVKEHVVNVPGNPTPTKTLSREWVCPDCDYFEEADAEGT